jgi:hypothetical protein
MDHLNQEQAKLKTINISEMVNGSYWQVELKIGKGSEVDDLN